MVINGAIVSDLDMMYIESVLQVSSHVVVCVQINWKNTDINISSITNFN